MPQETPAIAVSLAFRREGPLAVARFWGDFSSVTAPRVLSARVIIRYAATGSDSTEISFLISARRFAAVGSDFEDS